MSNLLRTVVVFLLGALPCAAQQEGLDMLFVELNCENLFDCQHDSLKNDEDFLPDGACQWTYGRYYKKLNNIARAILACGEMGEGQMVIPDLVALCEVENDSVLRDLTRRSLLRNAQYEYLVTNSPDARGIDVALLYSPYSFRPVASQSISIKPIPGMRPTRDILYVKGYTATADTLHVFVVHAPSRSGGERQTRPNRVHVATTLAESIDSIRTLTPGADIIVAGDFNDYHGDKSLQLLAAHGLADVSSEAKGRNGAEGTYKFQGKWGSLDHILLSDGLTRRFVSCAIADRDFLLSADELYGGLQPRRNFLGTLWRNGFSDHLPLVMWLRLEF